ncbi:N-acyl homoserine lactonase family protein [uncultured Agrococcus sp.]|uniref:N-acyl homoserine lactonase family protein n=1 Tax=uncultured Agrococcus sp. TaxID=382258 RepID=UPI0025E8F1A9|nr:N-acyl homoserine lactonase family protein [uncultured Agrococcus sp.]
MTRSGWEVIIIRHGTRTGRKSEAYMNFSFYGEEDAPYTTDYFLWVLRRGSDVILIDTGFSRAGAEQRGRTVLVDPVEALSRIGITPEQAPPIVVTHAHYDHIGNLDRFPASTLHIAASEYEFWTSGIATRPLFSHFGDQAEVDDLRTAEREGRLVQFSGETEIEDGVKIIEVGGHTPGQSMVAVETEEGQVLLASDAAHFYEELDRDMPFVSMADVPESYRVLERIRDTNAAHVVTGHDPSTLERFPGYGDPLQGIAAILGRHG